ncbi:VPA1267 family protein [Halomonas sp. AOP43-A1-21]|jgi:tetratricopeptide (TPR) repeat protein|uniref:VPA1267 family protein n=1 Tax=Halomonas TaxID=2745 RepID=UPI001867F09E|nr:VPA1267 family protein [Halomonas colorata]|tara:strand:- start:87 stop:527 length:441 start_codon:yes stop_codon:yes gene_type:complete
MSNGQERARQNLSAFQSWVATQTDDDFKQIIFRGQLNRGEVAKAIGIGKSALRQNPAIKSALENLEQSLRDRGVLPELTETAQAQRSEPKRYDPSVNQRAMESRRLSVLEQENIELKARVATLEAKLKRYGELSEVLTEFGVAPDA